VPHNIILQAFVAPIGPGPDGAAAAPRSVREIELAALFAQLLSSLCSIAQLSVQSLLDQASVKSPRTLESKMTAARSLLRDSNGTVEHGALALLDALAGEQAWGHLSECLMHLAVCVRKITSEPSRISKWGKSAICQSSERASAVGRLCQWMLESGMATASTASVKPVLGEALAAICGWKQTSTSTPSSAIMLART